MSAVTNQVSIIGNVGAAPVERAKTRDGAAVVSFAVAQTVSVPDSKTGQWTPKPPQWFQVSCFGSLAERARAHLQKGDHVLVLGELRSQTYTTKTGERRTAVEISASDVLRVERLRKPTAHASETETIVAPSFDEWTDTAVGGPHE